MHQHSAILQDIIVFLAAAGLFVPLMKRFAVSTVLGFIVIGFVIGPNGLARLTDALPWLSYVTITDAKGMSTFAELGVVFLLFMIGLELSVERLMAMKNLVFGFGAAQVAVTAVVIGLTAFAWANPPEIAILVGASLALSSTAIVMQLLIEQQRLATPVGRKSFAVLLFQDLAVVPILFLVGILGAKSGGGIVTGLALALLQAFAVIAAILLAGRLLIRPLFHFVGSAKSRELFMAVVLLVVIGTAALTEKAGLSLALGAFLAGLLLSETEFRHQIEVDVEPFKGLLLGLFFMTVGMSLDLAAVLADPIRIIGSAVGLYMLKAAIVYGLARLWGIARETAVETALLLGQGGEFAFVVLALAASLSLIEPDRMQFFLLVTILTMLATPLVAQFARRVAPRFAQVSDAPVTEGLTPPPAPTGELADHVIVAGYGRVGQLLGSMLETQRIPHVALDLDLSTVARFRGEDRLVYFGNASDPHVLERLCIEDAMALVVTMDDREAAEHIVKSARERWPHLPVVARARDRAHAKRLLSKGATSVVPETIEASLDLAEVVFGHAGITAEASRQIVADRRQFERAELTAE